MKKILVVNINWLGDAVFSLPVFKALRRAYPHSHIVCLCVSRVAEVLEFCPDINAIMVIDEKGRHFWPWQKAALILQLRSRKFDIALVLHRSLSRAMIVWLSGIKERVGFCKWPWLMTKTVMSAPEGSHRMDHYLRVVEAAGVDVNDRTYQLNAPASDVRIDGQYVVFNTGGNWDLKQWPKRSWVDLASVFKGYGTRVVFAGSQKDRLPVQKIIDESGINAENMCGKTSLGQSLALYAKADVVISADSGPLHLANSVGTKVIGLFGPTRPEMTGPRGIGDKRILFHEMGCNKTPCYHLGCHDNVCMKGISVDNVLQAYKELNC